MATDGEIPGTSTGGLRRFDSSRLCSLSDGVFGVALTVLVVTVIDNFPGLAASEAESLAKGLPALLYERLPALLMWLLSAVVIGTLWVAHHNIFTLIHRVDRWMLWANVFFLIPVTFLPLSAFLVGWRGVGLFSPPREAIVLYAVNLFVCAVMLRALWVHATNGRRLVDVTLSEALVTSVRRRMAHGIVVYFAAAVVALLALHPVVAWLPWVSILLMAALQIVYILPGHIDRQTALEVET